MSDFTIWTFILSVIAAISGGVSMLYILSARRATRDDSRNWSCTVNNSIDPRRFQEIALSPRGREAIQRVFTGRASSDWLNHYACRDGVRTLDRKVNLKTGQSIDVKPETPTLPEVRKIIE